MKTIFRIIRLVCVAILSVTVLLPAFADENSSEPQATDKDIAIGLCLSGGGYRAALFHLGVLWALNDIGFLKNTALISASSGGSITGALVVHRWRKMKLGVAGHPNAFQEEVVGPVRELTSRSVDVLSSLQGMVGVPSEATSVSNAYRKHLFGDTLLSDLPEPILGRAPRIVINATELQSSTLVMMSSDFLAGPTWGTVRDPKLPLATVVAASTAYPPVLGPVYVDISQLEFEDPRGSFKIIGAPGDFDTADVQNLQRVVREQLPDKLMLVDGGILDHRAMRTCLHNPDIDVYFVSDASKVSAVVQPVEDSWLAILRATVELLHDRSQSRWLDDVRPTSPYRRLLRIVHKHDNPEIALADWKSQLNERPHYIALENLNELPIWWGTKQRAWNHLKSSNVVEEQPATTITGAEQNFFVDSIDKAIKLANIETRLTKVDSCTQEHLINSAYMLTLASFDLRTIAEVAITNRVPPDRAVSLEAFQLLPFPLHPDLIGDEDKELYDQLLGLVTDRPSTCQRSRISAASKDRKSR